MINRKRNPLKFLFLALFVFSFSSIAQVRTFSLEEAVQTALQNNREIKIAKMNVDKSAAAVSEAFGYAFPSLDFSAGFSHFIKKPKMPFPDFESLLKNSTYSILFDENVIPRDDSKFSPVTTKLQSFAQTNNYETQLTLTQMLFSSAVFRGIGASQIYFDLAKAELKNTISKTVLSIQSAFYGVLLSRDVLEITRASFENAQDNLKNVKALYSQGLVSEFDMLQAEVQMENIRPMVLQMENNLKSAKDGFKILLGIDQLEEVEVDGKFTYLPENITDEIEYINEAMVSNFGIKSLDLKKQVDEEFIQLDVSEYWPTLAAFGNYTYAGSSDEFRFQNYSSLTVGLSLSINLWKGNQTKNRVEQSTITFKQTEEQLKQYKDFTIAQVKLKIQELKRVQSLIEAQEKNVNLAERAYKIAKLRYREGAGNQLEIQNADIALRQARINRLQSVYSYQIARFELDQLLGRTNPNYFAGFFEKED
jgi:outer membrane protein TolC